VRAMITGQKLSTFVRRELPGYSALRNYAKDSFPNFVKNTGLQTCLLLLPESSSNNFVAKYCKPADSDAPPFVIRQDGPDEMAFCRKRYLSIAYRCHA